MPCRRIPGSCGISIFNLWGTSPVAAPTCIPVNSARGFPFLHSLTQHLVFLLLFFNTSHAAWCEVIAYSGFDSHFLALCFWVSTLQTRLLRNNGAPWLTGHYFFTFYDGTQAMEETFTRGSFYWGREGCNWVRKRLTSSWPVEEDRENTCFWAHVRDSVWPRHLGEIWGGLWSPVSGVRDSAFFALIISPGYNGIF